MRIAGITIPNKRLPYALATLYGIGIPLGRTVCLRAGVDFNKKAGELSAAEEQAIRKELETIKMEGDLRRETAGNIKRLRDIGAYRGSRHTKRLPVRGQRTKTNARTKRGKKMTVGSGRKKSAEKT